MSRYKANRPDPVKVLEDFTALVAEKESRHIEIKQLDAEIAAFNEEAIEVQRPYVERSEELTAQRKEMVEAYNVLIEELMAEQCRMLQIMVEDMKA